MTGLVVWWPYAIVDIPNGWALCDGNNGTPDYRNYILIGAGDLYTPGQVLGALNHLHAGVTDFELTTIDGQTDYEYDTLDYGYEIAQDVENYYYAEYTMGHMHYIYLQTDGHNHNLDMELASSLPPCKAGCWIQKV